MKKIFITLALSLMLAVSAFARVPEGDLLEGVDPGPDGMIDVLTVFAHQDDESFYGGGTLLKMKKDERVRLHIMCMTLGDMSEAGPKLGITPEHQGRIRSEELETAAAVYGAEQVIQLGYHDQGLESADPEELVNKVLEAIKETGAEIVITHDPPGVTGHDDHITTSRVATGAFERSGAQKLYYTTFPPWGYFMVGLLSPFEGGVEVMRPTLKVEIRKEKRLKRMALYAHATQKHFSMVGDLMEIVMLFNHEWFIEAGENE